MLYKPKTNPRESRSGVPTTNPHSRTKSTKIPTLKKNLGHVLCAENGTALNRLCQRLALNHLCQRGEFASLEGEIENRRIGRYVRVCVTDDLRRTVARLLLREREREGVTQQLTVL